MSEAALDPAQSAAVAACAGSGKTALLIRRIVRILLAGGKPGEILAITFTRKAAGQIEERVNEQLRRFRVCGDDELKSALAEIGAPASAMPAARNLYRRAMLASPPMTVKTFHGWFLHLLSARGDAGGQIAAGGDALADEAWENLQAAQPGAAAAAFAELARFADPPGTRDLLRRFIGRQVAWRLFAGFDTDGVGRALAAFRAECNFASDDPPRWTLAGDAQMQAALAAAAGFVAPDDSPLAAVSSAAAAVSAAAGYDALAPLKEVIYTKAGGIRKRLEKAALDGNFSSNLNELTAAMERVESYESSRRALSFCRAALVAGTAWLDEIAALKRARGLLEPDDLETMAWRRIVHDRGAEHFQYYLDCRYRHILIDEFQDSSPAQWRIVREWLHSAHGGDLSVFIVGDARQSIYRFRGGDSRLFDEAQAFLGEYYGARRIAADKSFRCAPPILRVVDLVFRGGDGFAPHCAARENAPGRVEALPLAVGRQAEAAAAADGLRNPLITPLDIRAGDAHEAEGEQIAAKIAAIVGKWGVDGGARLCAPADIMILLRQRTHIGAIEAALRARKIPYQSDGGGNFLATLECADIAALLAFLCAPHRNLKLAQVLKSPIFAVDDRDLLALHRRAGDCLWAKLGGVDDRRPSLRRAAVLLGGWRDALRRERLPVHDLLDRIYAEGEIIARYRACAPPSMVEMVCRNLARLLAFSLEMGRRPLAPQFLEALRRAAVAGDSSFAAAPPPIADAVSVLTIHKAKGLEKPVVFLADADAEPGRGAVGEIVCDWEARSPSPSHFSIAHGRHLSPAQRAILAREDAAAKREQNNLLYVAMTRARDALIVSAASRRRGGDWHRRISAALREIGAAEDGGGLVYGDDLSAAAADVAPPPAAIAVAPPALAKLREPVGKRVAPPDGARRDGTLRHRLIALLLSGVADEGLLLKIAGGDPARAARILGEAKAVVGAGRLRELVDGARAVEAEVELVDGGGAVCRLDLLIETAAEVWVLDFKSAPTAARAARYLPQLRRYRAALAALNPAKPARAALVLADGELLECPLQ